MSPTFGNAPMHGLIAISRGLESSQRNLDWFRFWLQGYEDPDPDKHQQYVRWHAMKGAARKAP